MAKDKKHVRAKVLEQIRKHGRVETAARRCGITSRTIRKWRNYDPVFKAGFDAAMKEFNEAEI